MPSEKLDQSDIVGSGANARVGEVTFAESFERAESDEHRARVWKAYAQSDEFASSSVELRNHLQTEQRLLPLVEHANRAAREIALVRATVITEELK